MAQVHFFPMQLKFQRLRELLDKYDEARFASLIFQAQNPDARGNKDEYDLIAYIVAADGTTTNVLEDASLTRDTANPSLKKNANKIALGNYPFSRARIQEYVDNGNLVAYLLLQPEDFANDDRYVIYKITPKYKQEPIVETVSEDDDLQPSPPAGTG